MHNFISDQGKNGGTAWSFLKRASVCGRHICACAADKIKCFDRILYLMANNAADGPHVFLG